MENNIKYYAKAKNFYTFRNTDTGEEIEIISVPKDIDDDSLLGHAPTIDKLKKAISLQYMPDEDTEINIGGDTFTYVIDGFLIENRYELNLLAI
jgi:hypothetical protein